MRLDTTKARISTRWIVKYAIAVLALSWWTVAPAQDLNHATLADGARDERGLVFAVVASDVKRAIGIWEPIVKSIERKLPDSLKPLKLKVYGTHSGIAWDIWDGLVDVYFDEPFMALRMAADAGMDPLMALEGQDGELARAVLVRHRNSDIATLDQAAGARVAFDRISSTFGHVLARELLDDAGLTLVEDNADRPVENATAVRFVHTKDPFSPAIWLYKRRVDLAAMSEQQFNQLNRNRPGLFQIVAKSRPLPPALVVVRNTLPLDVCRQLNQSLAKVDISLDGNTGRLVPIKNGQENVFGMLDRLRRNTVRPTGDSWQ